MQEKPIIKVGVNVFVLKDGRLLLGKRIGKIGSGTWGLPGGHLEYGESLTDGAARELKEETGIVSNDLEFIHTINDPRDNCHYIHIGFIAKSWRGQPKITEPDKFAEWGWFDLKDLPQPIFVGHEKSIPAFIKKINFIDR